MLAGGDAIAGGRTPAKPRWSEVMIFLDVFLRRKGCCPEEDVSSDEKGAHRKTALRQLVSSGERMLAGGGSNAGGRTPAKPPWSEVMIFLDVFLRRKGYCPEEDVSSDEEGARRRRALRQLVSSGERMSAGGGCFADGCTPAKPRWSEVIVFMDVLLRRKGCCPEVVVSSDEKGAHRKTALRQLPSSGERMLAGGGSNVSGCTPAKPQWSEVIVFWDLFLRQKVSCPEDAASCDERGARRRRAFRQLLSSGERMLAGGGSNSGGRTPAKPQWSEVIVFFGFLLRQKNRSPEERAQLKSCWNSNHFLLSRVYYLRMLHKC